MCLKRFLCTVFLGVGLLPGVAISEGVMNLGGDVYLGDSVATLSTSVPRDVFMSGFSVNLNADVAEDAHAVGFDVDIDGKVGANLYAAGSNVRVDAPIGDDVTVTGFTVRLEKNSEVGGNTRIAAGTLTIDAPLRGSLLATAGSIKLNNSIDGNVRLAASDITFGSDAIINGTLTYSSAEQIEIPANVIAADRVRYQRLNGGDLFRDIQETVDESVPELWPTMVGRLMGLLIVLAFLLIVALVFLAFTPDTVERLRQRASEHAWRSLLYGFLGLSVLFGAIPVSVITIVGIPFLPIAVLLLITLWTLGYMLGVYVVALRIWRSLDVPAEAVLSKLLILASGLVAMLVVNFIPFIGWLLNVGVLFFGLGAMTYLFMERLVRRHDATNESLS